MLGLDRREESVDSATGMLDLFGSSWLPVADAEGATIVEAAGTCDGFANPENAVEELDAKMDGWMPGAFESCGFDWKRVDVDGAPNALCAVAGVPNTGPLLALVPSANKLGEAPGGFARTPVAALVDVAGARGLEARDRFDPAVKAAQPSEAAGALNGFGTGA